MTIKKLDFTVSRKLFERLAGRSPQGRPVVSLEVNLAELSQPARRLAKGVITLENGDDLSSVTVRSRLTQADLVRRDWDLPAWQRPFEKLADTPEGHIARLEGYFGYPWSEEKPTIIWRWDALKEGETPEEYFERHAAAILEIGAIEHCALEPYWMGPTEAHTWATKWGYGISHVALRKAMESGNIANARQDGRGHWQAPIGAVIDYLGNRPKTGRPKTE